MVWYFKTYYNRKLSLQVIEKVQLSLLSTSLKTLVTII